MLKRNHHTTARRFRPLRSLVAVLAPLPLLAAALAALTGGPAGAAAPPPVPVAGVASFGIGAGQLTCSGASCLGGVAVDAKGDLFVANTGNNQVVEYVRGSSATSYPKTGVTVAGAGGQGSGLSQLNGPTGLALDANGDLFVSDSGNDRVMEYAFNASTGSYASAGKVVAGATGTAGSGPSQLNGPGGLALDASGDLIVADTYNNRVQEFIYNSGTGSYAALATTIAGTGVYGTAANQFEWPTSVVLDAKGDLFVADGNNFRVMEYAYTASTGTYSASGTAIGGTLPDPASYVTLDASGDLFVSYGYLGYGGVQEIPYSAASGSFASSGFAVASGELVGPTGLALDSAGDLFAAQNSQTSNPNNTVWDLVLELTPTGGTYAPLGTIMSQLGRVNTGINSVAVDGHDNLFVADGPVYEFPFSPASATYSAQGTAIGTTSNAGALALDSSNDLFVASSGATGVTEYPWNAGSGSYPGSGSAVPGATQLSQLQVNAMAFDAHNNLFVAAGNQVLEFGYNAPAGTYAASGTVIATLNATASGYVYQGVNGLALDARGDLFASSPVTGQVQEYLLNAATGTYASAGITVAGAGGTGSGASQLNEPTSLAVDRSGDLFVFDAGNARVMEFTGNPATGAYAANGTAVFAGLQDNWPEHGGLALDAQGNLFFGNNYASAVVYEAPAGASAPPPPAPAVTGVSPSTGPAGGGTTVTVSGSNLSGGSVAFGATPATGVSCTAASCNATSPAGSGTVDVTVTTTGGTSASSAADRFTYQAAPPPPAPAVTAVSPPAGPAGGGTTVTVSGSNLSGGSVAFGATPATGVSCSAASCTAASPAGSGTVDVTVTTTGGTSAKSAADQFTYQAAPPPPSNLIPNPGFESAGVPADYWGSRLARSTAVVHTGSWSLAETTSSSSGGWDLDSNSAWYAPVSASSSYTAGIWVRSAAAVKVNLNVDLLDTHGNYVDSANGPTVTLAANTWTHLTITGIKPAAGEVYAAMEPNFAKATSGTVIYWDDMSLTSP